VVLLVVDDAWTRQCLEAKMREWNGSGRGKVGLLDVKGTEEGARDEGGFEYGQWLA
jgi:hypothetical protein